MQKIKNIIFDLDGTLIDSIPDIYKSINKSLEYINFPEISIDNIRKGAATNAIQIAEVLLKKGFIK